MYLHHVGILTDSSSETMVVLRTLGYSPLGPLVNEEAEEAVVQLLQETEGYGLLETITANLPGSHLVGKVPGLHHLCYAVDSIDDVLPDMRESGFLPIGKPKESVAFGGRRTAWFVVSQGNLLIELLEK